MSSLNVFDSNFINALVWTIMHSIWQFSLIALIMSILLKKYQNSNPEFRYNIALSSLAFCFIVALITFGYSFESGTNPFFEAQTSNVAWTETNFNGDLDSSFLNRFYLFIEVYQKPIFFAWMIGFIVFLMKFIISFFYVEFLSFSSRPIYNNETFKLFRKIYSDLNIRQKVEIGESKYINSPMILGVFKPIILFPMGIINNLDISETEAIIAHELAHFVRKDIYINTIQNVLEVLFYYHPAIWWISTNIKLERENCCDDLAIKYVGNKIQYAKTLVKIQEISQSSFGNLALQFSNKSSFFTNRIKRILQMNQTRNYLKEKVLTSVLLIALVVFFSKDVIGHQATNEEKVNKKEVSIIIDANEIENDSLPKVKESISIQRKTDDQDVKISMEDGKITKLEVDGEKIEEKDHYKYRDIIKDVQPKSRKSGNSNMFFFGDGDKEMRFEFEDHIGIDSILKGFDFKSYGNFDFNSGQMQAEMKKLQDQMGKMKFDFKGLDSMRFNFDNFVMPDMEKLKNHPNMKFYRFGDKDFPEMENEFHFYNDGEEKYRDGLREFEKGNESNFSESLGNALNRDGLLKPNQENKVELTGKYLKINGEKQPTNIWQKYKRIFEEQSGAELQKNSKLEFKFEGKKSKRKYRVY